MGEERHREGGEQQNKEQARHEREAALHALAGSSPPTAVAAPTSPAPRPRLRRRLLFALLLVCVVIAGGVGWWRFSQHPSGAATGPLILRFPDGHIRCPRSVSWSPDGKQVLVYGDSTCPNQQSGRDVSPDPQFEVYDPQTWRLTRDIHLLPLAEATIKPLVINPDLRHDQSALNQVSVGIGGPSYWISDSPQIATELSASTGNLAKTGGSQAPFWGGWLLLNLQTQAVQVTVLRPLLATSSPPPPQDAYRPNQLARVDLIGGTESDIAVSPGLGYRWDARDRLEATTPLPAWDSAPAAPPLGPVGQPIGGTSFTIWQQAVVSQAISYSPGCTPPYFPVQIQLSALSPDGRYLVEGISLNARFAAPASALPTPPGGWGNPDQCPPLPTTPPTDGPSRAPNFVAPLPIRDAGLAAALRAFASEPLSTDLRLAWSPDGTRLAVQENVRRQTPAGHFTIYDCASGKVLKQYGMGQIDPVFGQFNAPAGVNIVRLSWSPDSKQLLVYDYNRLVVLRGATLGG